MTEQERSDWPKRCPKCKCEYETPAARLFFCPNYPRIEDRYSVERHKAKDGALNIGAHAMQGIISNAEAQLAACEKNEALFDKVIEIIDTQEFDVEEPPVAEWQAPSNLQRDMANQFYHPLNRRF